jgi:hypothetical protein
MNIAGGLRIVFHLVVTIFVQHLLLCGFKSIMSMYEGLYCQGNLYKDAMGVL